MGFLTSAIRCAIVGLVATSLGCSRIVDWFLYRPDRQLIGTPGAVGLRYEDLRIPAADGHEIRGWWVPGKSPGPCVVFFYGNAGNMSHRLDIVRRMHDRLGVSVLVLDYRGYGKSPGAPSEKGLYADARGARAMVRARGWDRKGIVLYGRSLGAAVALRSATEDPPSGLVLEGAFTSLEEAAKTHYPIVAQLVQPWVSERYDNLSQIASVRCPVLFLHGDRDKVAPIEMGWRLFDACPEPKRFRTISGAGHDDPAFVGGDGYWDAWEDFLQLLGQAGETANDETQTDRTTDE